MALGRIIGLDADAVRVKGRLEELRQAPVAPPEDTTRDIPTEILPLPEKLPLE